MKRNAIQKLITWKEEGGSQPAFLYGCKGCGKTWLALDFARSMFEGYFYLNLENDIWKKRKLEERLDEVTDADSFYAALALFFDIPYELIPAFLFIFDEISFSEKIRSKLLYFAEQEDSRAFFLMIDSRSASFAKTPSVYPVFLAPLQFDEFLEAIGSEWYAEVISGHFQTSHRIPSIVHKELMDLFEDYLIIGGMPAAVNEYIQNESTDNIMEIHRRIFAEQLYFINKNEEESTALKMRQILEVIPAQLLKENQKFQYKLIRKGATNTMYQEAMERLKEYLFISVHSKYQDDCSFKVYLQDVGMYHSLTMFPEKIEEIQRKQSDVFLKIKSDEIMRRDILGTYVCQSLTAKEHAFAFWESGASAKIDFILQENSHMIPVEIKTNDISRTKSIGVFKKQYDVPYSIRLSSGNFETTEQQKNYPIYSLFSF